MMEGGASQGVPFFVLWGRARPLSADAKGYG